MSDNKEIDDRVRELFVNSLDKAFEFAVESRNVDALGSIANLCGGYIEWERPKKQIGFTTSTGEEDE